VVRADRQAREGIVEPLSEAGHPVVAAANPLRSLAGDARSVSDLILSTEGRSCLSPTPMAAP
jgi:hypothetical protein